MTEREREMWSQIENAQALLDDVGQELKWPRDWLQYRDDWRSATERLREEREASAVDKDAAPPGGTLERKIWNTAKRHYDNRGEWPTAGDVAGEHGVTNYHVVAAAQSSRFLELLPVDQDPFGYMRPFEGNMRVRAVEPNAVPPNIDDTPDQAEEDDGAGDDAKKLPLHVALLEDMRRWCAGEPWLSVEAYPKPSDHWSRRRNWPECLLNGASRNMAVMALFLRSMEGLKIGDDACYHDTISLVLFERYNGFDVEEAWGEYLAWNKLADLGIFWTMQDPGLKKALRAQAAVWRLMLPGTPEQPRPITVRNDRGKVVYHGFGSRNPGGRELPKSEHQLHAGLGDAIFAKMLGYEWQSTEYDNQRTPESQILQHFIASGMVPDFSDLRDFDTAVEVAKGYRPHRPFVIERYVDGSVVAWFEQALSSQTGTLFAVWQLPDGEGYFYLFPYPKDRIRAGWAKENGGSLKAGAATELRETTGHEARDLVATNGVERNAIYRMPLPGANQRTHRWRWSL